MKIWTLARQLVAETARRWIRNRTPHRSAALSYYTVFSLAPLLLLTLALVGLFFGREGVQGEIVSQVRDMMGMQSAQALESMMQAADKHSAGVIATICPSRRSDKRLS